MQVCEQAVYFAILLDMDKMIKVTEKRNKFAVHCVYSIDSEKIFNGKSNETSLKIGIEPK